jgi:HNH endonuclease
MQNTNPQRNEENVLVYTARKIAASTLRRHYLAWRESQGMPLRCDIKECSFHTGALVWNEKPLKLVLDHVNGVNSDNRTKNLRLVCPNCNASLPTHGGGNKNRVEKSEGGFALKRADGKKSYVLPVEPATIVISGGNGPLTKTYLMTAIVEGRYEIKR